MNLADIIDADSVVSNLKAQSKKQLLQELAAAAARACALDERLLYETFHRREKLGSTGLGQGVAVPHGRLAPLARVHGVFARLAQPVEFGSTDGVPVDLVFALVAPEHAGADHLTALARISRLLRDAATVAKLRATASAPALYAILIEPQGKTATAA